MEIEYDLSIYQEFQDLKLSALGMGTMRLPVFDGDEARINEAAAEEMITYAMEQGINYYDTAWGYHDGNSELVVGRALSKYLRESFYLAAELEPVDLSLYNIPEKIWIFWLFGRSAKIFTPGLQFLVR